MEQTLLYDIYLTYSRADKSLADALRRQLEKRKVLIFSDVNMMPGDALAQTLDVAMNHSRIVIPVISESSVNSSYMQQDVRMAMNRSKRLIPVYFGKRAAFADAELQAGISRDRQLYLEKANCVTIAKTADAIEELVQEMRHTRHEHEKLMEYMKLGANDKAAELLCNVIADNSRRYVAPWDRASWTEDLIRLTGYYEKMHQLYNGGSSEAAQRVAARKLAACSVMDTLLEMPAFQETDIVLWAIAIRLIYFHREISLDCEAAKSDGIRTGDAYPLQQALEKQQTYVQRYNGMLESCKGFTEGDLGLSADHVTFVLQSAAFICGDEEADDKKPVAVAENTKDSELLRSIARFMQEGNHIFDIIGNQTEATEFLRCLLISYERLNEYCQVIGEQEIAEDCVERMLEIKGKMKSGQNSSISERAEVGIKTLLGLTAPNSGKFDVFICHKSQDFDIAEDMYHFMKEHLKEAFLDTYSLPELSESEYKKAIMSALEYASHFVVILSDLAYLENKWVSLEMSIFQSEIDEGRKPHSNFIMVVTDEVFDRIISSNKTVLPIEYRRCQIMRVRDYKRSLLGYIS